MSKTEELVASVDPYARVEALPEVGHDELPVFDKNLEKKLLRKLDLTVMPILWLLFLVSFIDRGNIGNAAIAGMRQDLNLTGNRYNIAVQLFTAAYVVFNLPANILFKKTGPKSLAVMIFLWGLCVIGQGVTKTYGGLYACRYLEGMCEAGFVPGAAYLIGTYYKRDEFLRRYAFFFSSSILAGTFNGLLAYAIAKMDGIAGYGGWRWIFIIEGCATIFVSIISFFIIVPFPEDNKSFTPEEKDLLLARLKADGAANAAHDRLDLLNSLKDWKIWVAALTYLGAEENVISVVAFQPTVLQGLGYTSSAAQVHTIPVYAVAFVLSLACAALAERLGQRFLFAMVGAVCSIIGLSIEIAQPKHAGVKYMGMFFVEAGPVIIMPIMTVWLAINLDHGYKRTVGLGILIGLGNCGAFISGNVFLTSEMPKYLTGFSVCIGMTVLSIVGMIVMYLGLRWENKRRDQGRLGYAVNEGAVEEVGEKHPQFRYAL